MNDDKTDLTDLQKQPWNEKMALPPEKDLEAYLRSIQELEDDLGETICRASSLVDLL